MKKFIGIVLCIGILITAAPLSVAAGGVSATPENSEYVAGEVIITQKTDVNTAALPIQSAEILQTDTCDGEPQRILKAKVACDTDIEQLCDTLEKRADVLQADPNYIQYIDEITLPSEAEKTGAEYNAFNWYKTALQLKDAWQSADTLGSRETTVAVIDTGINTTHKEFEGALWEDAQGHNGYNAVSDNYDVTDYHGHGSNVAGIIAMRANDFGYVGIAPQVKIMALKATNASSLTDADILECLRFALDNGADIINMSFGSDRISDTMAAAYQRAARKCVIIAAAGNQGINAADALHYPAACGGVVGVMSYGSYDNEDITHYTIDNSTLSSFSNYDATGQYYQIAAPGVEIEGPSHKDNTSFVCKSGTSQATPIVAGTAALYLSLYPDATPYQVREALIRSAVADIDGYYDAGTYKELQMASALATEPCAEPSVALSEDAISLLSACFDEPITNPTVADMDALTTISPGIVSNLAQFKTAVAELTTVQRLDLSDTDLTDEDIAFFEQNCFDRLFILIANDNALLHTFSFSRNSAPILKELHAEYCAIENVRSLENLSELQTLNLNGNPLVSSYQFRNLSFLQELSLAGCRLQDVNAFQDWDNLTYLDVSENLITDISPLRTYRGSYLNVSDNPLNLGTQQEYCISDIETFMTDNGYASSSINFLHNRMNDENDNLKAQSLCLAATEFARTQTDAALCVAVEPQTATVNTCCRFMTEDESVQLDEWSGALRWDSAQITRTKTITVRTCPVSGFAAFENFVKILAPEVTAFSYDDGQYTLKTNLAASSVSVSGIEINTFECVGNEHVFTVPKTVIYSPSLQAVPQDEIGSGIAFPIGQAPQNSSRQATLRSAESDKQNYFTNNTAQVTITADTATERVKIQDDNHQTSIIVSAYEQVENSRIFRAEIPLKTAGRYRLKAYAGNASTFFAGAKLITFTAAQTADMLKLSSESGSVLYFAAGKDSLSLQSTFYPKGVAAQTLTFDTADSAVATVTPSGKVCAEGYGETIITACSENGLQAVFPVVVSAPIISDPTVTDGYVGESTWIECYTTGAESLILKNLDGSDYEGDYTCVSSPSDTSDFDTKWTIGVNVTDAAPLTLNIYAADADGLQENTRFRQVLLTPIEPVQSFDFTQSAYTFARHQGAVKIQLDVIPATSNEYFNWTISTNTVATIQAFENYCILTPKKSGSLTLTAYAMIDGEECAKSVRVSFTEGSIYSAETDVESVALYEEVRVHVVTDTSVTYLDITDSYGLQQEFSAYCFFEDSGNRRIWELPYHFKRESTAITISGGDVLGNLEQTVDIPITAYMPETDFAANPPVVYGEVDSTGLFRLIHLPDRTDISFRNYTVQVEDESIATFSLGTVFFLKEGETVLHCTYGTRQTDVRLIAYAPVEEIDLGVQSITLAQGEHYRLTPVTVPASSESLFYESDNESVATVGTEGEITAVGSGTATVRVRSQSGVSTTLQVKVKSTDVITALAFDSAEYTLQSGETLHYHLLANTDIENKITYTSSNTNIISVDENGTFIAHKEGIVSICAVSDSGITASAQVHVTANRHILLSSNKVQSTVNSSFRLGLFVSPDGVDVDGVWFSDNEQIAVVTQNGSVSAKAPGRCNIYYMSTRNEIAVCALQVDNVALTRINITQSTLDLNINDTCIIPYIKYPTYSRETPQWTSADERVACVDANGFIYAVGAGNTIIQAKLQNGKTYVVDVNVSAEILTLSGTINTAAVLDCTTADGVIYEYDVSNELLVPEFTSGCYTTLRLRAPHHTSLTLTDAGIFTNTDLGTLYLFNGDVNGDGCVDIGDISCVLQNGVYGQGAAQGGAQNDVNDDTLINLKDINEILLAENYGGTDRIAAY